MKKLLLSFMCIFLLLGCSKEEIQKEETVEEEVVEEKIEIEVAEFLEGYNFIEEKSTDKIIIYRGIGNIEEVFNDLKEDIFLKEYTKIELEETEETVYNNSLEAYFEKETHTLLIEVKDIDDSQIEIRYEVK